MRMSTGEGELAEEQALKIFMAYEDFISWLRSDRDIMVVLERLSAEATDGKTHDDDSCEDVSDDCDSDLDMERSGAGAHRQGAAAGAGAGAIEDEDMGGVMELVALASKGGGDEFMAVKPFVGAIKEPTVWVPPKHALPPPTTSLELEWVHGYRSFDCRNNLRYVPLST